MIRTARQSAAQIPADGGRDRAGVTGVRAGLWHSRLRGAVPRTGGIAMFRLIVLTAALSLAATSLSAAASTDTEGGAPVAYPDARSMTPAQVSAALRANPDVYQGLFALALAHGIRDICPSIEERSLRVNFFTLGLYNRARSLGFSHSQVTGFVEDQSEVDRMFAEVIAHVRARGVRETDIDAVCALGRAEIAAGTQAGALLRQR